MVCYECLAPIHNEWFFSWGDRNIICPKCYGNTLDK
jgi:hypothetical protein